MPFHIYIFSDKLKNIYNAYLYFLAAERVIAADVKNIAQCGELAVIALKNAFLNLLCYPIFAKFFQLRNDY